MPKAKKPTLPKWFNRATGVLKNLTTRNRALEQEIHERDRRDAQMEKEITPLLDDAEEALKESGSS